MTHTEIVESIFGDEDFIEVEVTQEDIDKGTQGSCYVCPIARAVSRVVPSCRVSVTEGKISLLYTRLPMELYRVGAQRMSKRLKQFVNHFDHPLRDSAKYVRPFTFQLFRNNFIVDRNKS